MDFLIMENKKEIWKDILGFENNYMISSHGRVMSKGFNKIAITGVKFVRHPKILKQRLNSKGYYYVGLYKKDTINAYSVGVHRLICQAFVENTYNKPHVNHIDAVKTNNSIDNLEWCTIRENIQHAHKMGLYDKNRNRGSKVFLCKLSEKEVIEIRRLSKKEYSQKELAKMFNISQSNISDLLNRKSWKHI